MLGSTAVVSIVLFAITGLSADDDEKPEAFVRAQQARSARRIATARLELLTRRRSSRDLNVIHTRFATWKCAQDRFILVDGGDEEGVYRRDERGQPTQYTFNGPDSWLVMDGKEYRHQENSLGADIFPKGDGSSNLWDVRASGLGSGAGDGDYEATCAESGTKIRWSSCVEGALHVVTANVDGASLKWWIDPQKDWSVVKCDNFLNDRKLAETRYELEQLDGIWFPRKTELFPVAADNPTEPSLVIEVLAAEFNRPEHPRELSTADIGIDAGMEITTYKHLLPEVSIDIWDGRKPITHAKYAERLKSGELTPGPMFQRYVSQLRTRQRAGIVSDWPEHARKPGHSPLVRMRVESEWEAYTRRFIETHQLDSEQTVRAQSILMSCQDRAREHVAKHVAEFDEFQKPAPAASATGNEHVLANTQPSRGLGQRWEKLLEPIVGIFDNELKPRLDRLPTRAQREAARQRGWPDSPAPEVKKP